MVSNLDLEKYDKTYSVERLSSFAYSENDTINDIIDNYSNNIQISLAIYPELCTLEIILRNALDSLLKNIFSENWIEEEVKNNKFLDEYDYQTLLKAYNDTKNDCTRDSKPFTAGKVVANLNFGFWTNLCVKKYNSTIWNSPRRFKSVFVTYPYNNKAITYIAKKLYCIRRFRNRIFHYEKVFKYPARTLHLYNDILEMLSYLPQDELNILNRTSLFLDTYNKLMEKVGNKKT